MTVETQETTVDPQDEYKSFIAERHGETVEEKPQDEAEEPVKDDKKLSSEEPETEEEEENSSESPEDADDAPEEDESDEESDTSDDNKRKTRKSGFKRRIDKLNTRNAALEEDIRRLREKYEGKGSNSDSAKGQQSEGEEKKPNAEAPKRPRMSDFESIDEYEEALDKYHDARRKAELEDIERKAEERYEQRHVKERGEKILADFYTAGNKIHQDFQQTVSNKDLKLSRVMSSAIIQRNMHEVAYHLAKNPDIAQEIFDLPEVDQIYRMVELDVELKGKKKASPAPSVAPVKPAPKPPVTVSSKAPASDEPEETDDYEEYKRRREKQLRRKR